MCSIELREEGEFTVLTKDRQGIYERCAKREMRNVKACEAGEAMGEGNHLYIL